MQIIQERGVMHSPYKTTCQSLSMCFIPAPPDSPSSWTNYEKVRVIHIITFCNVCVQHDNSPPRVSQQTISRHGAFVMINIVYPNENRLDTKPVIKMEILHQQNRRKMICYCDDCSYSTDVCRRGIIPVVLSSPRPMLHPPARITAPLCLSCFSMS